VTQWSAVTRSVCERAAEAPSDLDAPNPAGCVADARRVDHFRPPFALGLSV